MSVVGVLTVLFLVGLRIAEYFSAKDALEESATVWDDFARRHGMNSQRLFIQGIYEGFSLAVDTRKRRIGRNTYTLSVIHLRLPALSSRAVLKSGGLFRGPVHHVLTPPEAEALLNHPRVQQCLLNVASAYYDFYIQEGFLHAERINTPKTDEQLEAFLRPALDLARALNEVGSELSGQRPHGT